MNGTKKTNSHLSGFSSRANLGGKVSRYRNKETIYKQARLRIRFSIFKKAGCG
jgi:hypothetical protein